MLRADRNLSVENQVMGVQEMGIQAVEEKVYEPEVVEHRRVRYPVVGVYNQLTGGAYGDLDEATIQAYERLGVRPPKPKFPMYYLTLRGGFLVEKTPDGEFVQHKEYLGQLVVSARIYKMWDDAERRFWKLAYKPRTDAELHQLLVEQYGFNPMDAQRFKTSDVKFYREIGLNVFGEDGSERKCILTVSSTSSGRYEEYVRRLLSKGLVYQDVLTKMTGEMYFDPKKNNTYPVVNFEALDLETKEPLGVDTYDMSGEQTQGNKGAKGKKKH